jgi:hypothetical protein
MLNNAAVYGVFNDAQVYRGLPMGMAALTMRGEDATHLLNRSIFSPLKSVLPSLPTTPPSFRYRCALIRKVCPLWHVGRARSVENEGRAPFHVVIGDSLVGRPLRLRPFPPTLADSAT